MKSRLEAMFVLVQTVAFAWVATLLPILHPGDYDDVLDWVRDIFGMR